MFLINRVPKAVGQGGRPSQPHCHFLTMTTGSSKQSFMALFSHEIINCPEKGGGVVGWRGGERGKGWKFFRQIRISTVLKKKTRRLNLGRVSRSAFPIK